jgi:ubiquinone/menaquinone biosynthesis C-methylase UbiE
MSLPTNYIGLEAGTYDALWEHEEYEDEGFFQWIMPEEGQPVLEAGCGTGRITRALAREGFNISGFDSSEEMLEICRRKAAAEELEIPLYHQRMESLELESTFQTIIIPAFSFQLIPERHDAREALRRFFDHLEPGGQLAIATFVPWAELESPSEGLWRLRKTGTQEGSGNLILCHEAVFLDRYEQLLTLWNRYELYDENRRPRQVETRDSLLRWYPAHEMMSMLRDTGFTPINAYGDFEPEPARDGHTTVTYLAHKPE